MHEIANIHKKYMILSSEYSILRKNVDKISINDLESFLADPSLSGTKVGDNPMLKHNY